MQFLSPFKIHSEGCFFDAVRAKGRPFFVSFFGRAKKESKQGTNGKIVYKCPEQQWVFLYNPDLSLPAVVGGC